MSPNLDVTVARLSKLGSEVVQVGPGWAGAEFSKRERVFEVGGQHTVILYVSVIKVDSIKEVGISAVSTKPT